VSNYQITDVIGTKFLVSSVASYFRTRYVTFGYEVGESRLRNSLTLSVYVRLTVSVEDVQQGIY
jgi:hypothetical protein